jgi:hypothetical protein
LKNVCSLKKAAIILCVSSFSTILLTGCSLNPFASNTNLPTQSVLNVPTISPSLSPTVSPTETPIDTETTSTSTTATKKIQATIKATNQPLPTAPIKDVEKYIIDQLNTKKTDSETRSKIFSALTNIDWKKYAQIHKSTDVELIDWLGKQENLKDNEIKNIISGTKNLDGAYAEGYGDILSTIFTGYPTKFAHLLSNYQLTKTDEICNTMFIGILGTNQTIKDSVKDKLIKYNAPSQMEKDIVSKLISLLSRKL